MHAIRNHLVAAYIVNAYSQIAMTGDTPWMARLFEERKGLRPEGIVTPELISLMLEQPNLI